ncbi:MAG: hypothetical protein J6O13_13340 [Selenomonas sp.]|nr:hypothetical protein [Selenomonas sp.]
MAIYRIHGDNIIECERIADIVINTLNPADINYALLAPSTPAIKLQAKFEGVAINLELVLLPGFNKNTKKRWEDNIFYSLREAGSYLDETPDAIITSISPNGDESILLGVEFCSALQAGNQAWQRSARAFSTGRTGCPYLYIVDFVKYELDNVTRTRKNLRFPNAAVPYSYVSFAKNTNNFIAQLYVKSEEFDKSKDSSIADFDSSNFGDKELGKYIVSLMLGKDTKKYEELILKKNMRVVEFLANHFDSTNNFDAKEWEEIYGDSNGDIVQYSVNKHRFNFHKTIASKSHHGKSSSFVATVDKMSVGLSSKDLPFGIIPAQKRKAFSKALIKIYPKLEREILERIGTSDKHLITAIFKGFKPRGDDNRPDRGLLPLAAMLSKEDVDILSFIYGPMVEANLRLLDSNPIALAKKNGLWKTVLSLSNYLILDVPVIAPKKYSVSRIYDTSRIKFQYSCGKYSNGILPRREFSHVSVNLGEDDVDTAIHYLFKHILGNICFEGMCNPPGGDWSGFSVIDGDSEVRWLSLPRVSNVVEGKRPDHILQISGVFQKPLLLSVESKERSVDLEEDVGTKLITYIEKLMNYVPSAKRKILPVISEWTWGDSVVDFNSFDTMSAAAYLKDYAQSPEKVFEKNCEILFILNPVLNDSSRMWEIEIIPSTTRSEALKDYIIRQHRNSNDNQFILM